MNATKVLILLGISLVFYSYSYPFAPKHSLTLNGLQTSDSNPKDTTATYRKNLLSLELGGHALMYSLNYERLIYFKPELFFALGGGFSYVHMSKPSPQDDPSVSVSWTNLTWPLQDAYCAYPMQMTINYGLKI
jgi:hypothetical protein